MNRRLAKTIVRSFHAGDAGSLRRELAAFRVRDWQSVRRWLHTSGLALYLLDRATQLGIEDVVPAELVREFAVCLTQNRGRTAHLFDHFVRLNTALQRARITYVNLKGFSLAPAAFADPAFRYMQDLDLLVVRQDVERCARALQEEGYRFHGMAGKAWEFRSGTPSPASMKTLYSVRSVQTVEVHAVSDAEEARARHGGDRMSRMQLQTWNGFEFPALGEADKIIAQASHLFHHFKAEWTRTGWIVEYANALRARAEDGMFWREVAARIEAAPEKRGGVGLATLVMSNSTGVPMPRVLRECTVEELTPELRLFGEHYGEELVYTAHPGSKLYLLLLDVLEQDREQWREIRRSRLLPLHLPVRLMQPAGSGVWRRWTAQAKYIAGRLRFHLSTSLHYKLEAARWRRFVAAAGL